MCSPKFEVTLPNLRPFGDQLLIFLSNENLPKISFFLSAQTIYKLIDEPF
jgi:hypothetical protein